jgi:hypothetical protein
MSDHIQIISWTNSKGSYGNIGFVKDEKTARKIVKKLVERYSVDKQLIYYYHQLAEINEDYV